MRCPLKETHAKQGSTELRIPSLLASTVGGRVRPNHAKDEDATAATYAMQTSQTTARSCKRKGCLLYNDCQLTRALLAFSLCRVYFEPLIAVLYLGAEYSLKEQVFRKFSQQNDHF